MTLISEYLMEDFSLAELARRRGVSRKTVYKWVERYREHGVEGLQDLSRAAHEHPNAISEQMRELILEWKERRPLWGAPKIHSKLRDLAGCPAESTISNVLKRHGLTRQRRRRARASYTVGPLQTAAVPNDIWCADFKGWFRLGNAQRCDPLTISDAFSRYLLCCRALAGAPRLAQVRPWFERTFTEYGLPRVIRTDNGPPFASTGIGGLSALAVWWMRLGIAVERIAPGHPEQNGRHERMHRTLKESMVNGARADLAAQQRSFNAFRRDYNLERPHEALGQNPPASVYQPSSRSYRRCLLQPEYSEQWLKRSVRSNGEIKWRGSHIFVGEALIGQSVALEPVADGKWVVHFMRTELGVFDEREQRIQRIRWHRTVESKPTEETAVSPLGSTASLAPGGAKNSVPPKGLTSKEKC